MSQTPLGYNTVNPAGNLGPNQSDSSGNLLVANGSVTALNINTAATVVKVGVGRVVRVLVNTAGSTAGSVSDAATTGAVAAANLISAIPNTAGPLVIDAPFVAGLVITPGTGQVLSVVYD